MSVAHRWLERYRADAESPLVRGLVALLLLPYQGKTPREVLDVDPAEVFGPLHLEDGLSAKRRAGMLAFLDRVRRIARSWEPAGTINRVLPKS